MSEPSQGQCQSLQVEEREVLKSIFPDDITFSDDDLLHIEIPIELANPLQVELTSEGPPDSVFNSSSSQPNDPETRRISVSALPPILLDVRLPPTYPLYSPPEVIAIHATHSWFINASELQDLLLQSWVAGDVVLFNWIETVHSGKFLEDLALVEDNTFGISAQDAYALATTLSKYNDDTHLQEFLRATYACSICMDLYKGSRCIRLSCSHIFCRPCLTGFWVLSITEGDIDKVACVYPECLRKKDNRASPDEIKELVTSVLYDRWKDLRLKRAAEIDPEATFCPRCEIPVWPGTDAQHLSAWGNYRICSGCSFSYCILCLRIWHGVHVPCPTVPEHVFHPPAPNPPPELQGNRTKDKDTKDKPVKIYKRLLARTKAQKKRDMTMSEQWITKYTMKCPGCQVPVWRDYGCNYMRCTRCGQCFCYECGQPICLHTPHGPCYLAGHE